MMRWLAAAVAVGLTVALVWFAGVLSGDRPVEAVAAATQEEGAEERTDRGREASAGHGPPSWAKGHGGGHARAEERAWHEAWRGMTPKQREETMTRFAREHASGMRAWTRCVAEGRDDCEKPLPPGLAKKQLRP